MEITSANFEEQMAKREMRLKQSKQIEKNLLLTPEQEREGRKEFVSDRFVSWLFSLIYNVFYVFRKNKDKSDLSADTLSHEMIDLSIFLEKTEDFDKISAEIDEIQIAQRAVLLRVANAGVDAVSPGSDLMNEMLAVNARAAAMTDYVHRLYRKEVTFRNIF